MTSGERQSRIEPLGNPVWRGRADRAVGLVRELGPTATEELVAELCRRFRWTGDRARNALAAAHPLVLEQRGVWHLGELAPAREPKRTKSVESSGRRHRATGFPRQIAALLNGRLGGPPVQPGSERQAADRLGVSRRTVRYRRDREAGPLGTNRCSICRQKGHTKPTCPRRSALPAIAPG